MTKKYLFGLLVLFILNMALTGCKNLLERLENQSGYSGPISASPVVPGLSAGDQLGKVVAISGNHFIAGVPRDGGKGYKAGAVYIFSSVGPNVWDIGAKIVPPDVEEEDHFGHSVSISGDYAIAGAYLDDDDAINSGAAYIFKKTASGWDSITKLKPHNAAINDFFGWAVAISGDYAIVSALTDIDTGTSPGSAYIFHRTGANSWDEGFEISAPDGAEFDFFGNAVAISGDYAIVGSFFDDTNGPRSGSAYIFRRTGENIWDAGTKILAPDGATGDNFGHSVSISGNYAIVGALGYDDGGMQDSGAAYVFRRTGINTWDGGTKILAPNGAAQDNFGHSVSIFGDYAIVGANGHDDFELGVDSGSAYIFVRTDINSWDTSFQYVQEPGSAGDGFGVGLAMTDNYAIIGADHADDSGPDSGSLRILAYEQLGCCDLYRMAYAGQPPFLRDLWRQSSRILVVEMGESESWQIWNLPRQGVDKVAERRG